jgi:phenylpyruvate tautomerase PptA (4-oxalocrotonate tautomerase family)
MPFIQCHIRQGLSESRRAKLIGDIVQATHEAIGSHPKIINVLLTEHPAVNMCISGRDTLQEPPEAAPPTPEPA